MLYLLASFATGVPVKSEWQVRVMNKRATLRGRWHKSGTSGLLPGTNEKGPGLPCGQTGADLVRGQVRESGAEWLRRIS